MMKILSFNGSPRKKGNTSTIIETILKGARSAGAETTEVRLHDINMKGCMGCLSCRNNPGFCKQQDDLSPYLEAIKTCDGMIIGCPIYMYRISGQMKLLVDRIYSLYINREDGGYDSAVSPGKTFAMVISQGAPDPDQYHRSVRWLSGMTGGGLGMNEVGRIVHANSQLSPAIDDGDLLEEARRIGQKLVMETRHK